MNFLQKISLFGCALLATVAIPVAQDVHAEDTTEVREIRSLSFGQIGRPTISSNTFTLHWQNNNVTTSGAGDGFHLGGATSGRYHIRGLPYQTVTISADILSFSAEGIVVEEVYVNGPSNTYSTTVHSEGVTMARIGGVVVIHPHATVGLHRTDILLSINYE